MNRPASTTANPDDIAAQAGLLAQQGREGEAQALLLKALEQYPTHCALRHNLAELYRNTDHEEEAQAMFTAIVNQYPRFMPSYQSLINLLKSRFDAMLSETEHAALQQQLAIVINNMGNALLEMGQIEAAKAAYSEALQTCPNYPSAYSNLSNVLRQMGEVTAAEALARQALTLRPNFAEAWNNLGSSLSEQGRMGEATHCYQQALRLNPTMSEARHNAGSGSLFMQLYRDDISTADIVETHRQWGQNYPAPARNYTPPCSKGKRRIGFISGDFREHAMMQFVIPVLEKLDRDRFDIICYANQTIRDGITRSIESLALTVKPTTMLNDAALCDLIAQDNLHLLIDLSGHTRDNRLYALAQKPAPVMANWLGYMFTSGLPAFDYRITDPWTDPPETATEKHTEKLVYLERSQFTYRPKDNVPPVNSLPALRNGFITFGSLNNIQKINRHVIETWSALLRAVPNSCLILQSKLLADQGIAQRMFAAFQTCGVSTNRIQLRPSAANYLETYHAIDIALDTFPYNGGTTSCDALWMGVPVLALAGDRSVGRMGVSILNALAMQDWIAGSTEHYVVLGEQHAASLDALAARRESLRTHFAQSTLRDEAAFAADMARCFTTMIQGKI